MTTNHTLRTDETADAFSRDPHIQDLINLMDGHLRPPAEWMTFGAAFPYPPAFVPIIHDTSGTMYGAWIHVSISRPPCFVGISTEENHAKEIARSIKQFWTFLALLASTTLEEDIAKLEPFLRNSEVSVESIMQTSREVGDDRDLFGAHPIFAENCPSALRNGRPSDNRFPSSDLPDTWPLACGFELAQSDLRAPPWIRQPGPSVFTQQITAHSWAGAWLSLNSPGWEITDARDAARLLSSTFKEVRTEFLSKWSREVAGFATGY